MNNSFLLTFFMRFVLVININVNVVKLSNHSLCFPSFMLCFKIPYSMLLYFKMPKPVYVVKVNSMQLSKTVR